MEQEVTRRLLDFLDASPSCYHAVDNLARRLEAEGYERLREAEPWTLCAGGKYYVVRGDSSLAAFRVPGGVPAGFMLAAAHSDSPTYKVREEAEVLSAGNCVRLAVEPYGGMIARSWLDRPLSVAGRLVVRREGGIATQLVNVDRDLLVIPNVAIHMNRNANDGMKYQANVDTYPLFGDGESAGAFPEMIARCAGAAPEAVLGSDLFLYARCPGTLLGDRQQFIHAPKLDDLECAWSLMQGFLAAEDSGSLPVCCVFDNEEVGSSTKQGAASAFLRDTLRRIVLGLGGDEELLQTMLAQSFLVSADNAHARHPNHPEYADGDNCPFMNQGVVIKYNANQRYATDGVSAAIFRRVCQEAGVPTQVYANRSDLPGGGTLGSIADTQVPVNTVDLGLAQLAMHSACETAGVRDLAWLKQAMEAYFGRTLTRDGDGNYCL